MSETPSEGHPEQRRYRRVRLQSPVIVVASGQVQTLAARDIGPGGVFVYAASCPSVGSQVRVEFDLGKDRHFAVPGKVIRDDTVTAPHGRPGFAIGFEAREELREEIDRALGKAG